MKSRQTEHCNRRPIRFAGLPQPNFGVGLTDVFRQSIDCKVLIVLVLVISTACEADIDQSRTSPEHAAIHDDAERLRELVAKGLNVDAQNKYGQTLLHIASREGSIDVVQLLLREGALVEVKDHNGDTALFHAAGTDRLEIVRILLEAGAKPNVVDRYGNCPLGVAVAENNREVAELLREHAAIECN